MYTFSMTLDSSEIYVLSVCNTHSRISLYMYTCDIHTCNTCTIQCKNNIAVIQCIMAKMYSQT